MLVTNSISDYDARRIEELQPRCIACGSTYGLQRHHRIFRSEGEQVLNKFLLGVAFPLYEQCYNAKLEIWHLHSIQNLCTLCLECHEGTQGRGVHGGNEKLRQQLRNSFTCPVTGFCVPFVKNFKYA